MSSSQFPNLIPCLDFATCVCLSDIWYKFIFLCICALTWNVLAYCQNARFGSCWLAERDLQLPQPIHWLSSHHCTMTSPLFLWFSSQMYKLLKTLLIHKLLESFSDFPLFPTYPSLNCLNHVRWKPKRRHCDVLPTKIPPQWLPFLNLCPDGEVPPQIVATSMYFCTEDDWEVSSDAVLLNWKQILPLRDSIHTGPQYFAAGSSSS